MYGNSFELYGIRKNKMKESISPVTTMEKFSDLPSLVLNDLRNNS